MRSTLPLLPAPLNKVEVAALAVVVVVMCALIAAAVAALLFRETILKPTSYCFKLEPEYIQMLCLRSVAVSLDYKWRTEFYTSIFSVLYILVAILGIRNNQTRFSKFKNTLLPVILVTLALICVNMYKFYAYNLPDIANSLVAINAMGLWIYLGCFLVTAIIGIVFFDVGEKIILISSTPGSITKRLKDVLGQKFFIALVLLIIMGFLVLIVVVNK